MTTEMNDLTIINYMFLIEMNRLIAKSVFYNNYVLIGGKGIMERKISYE
jgi:hypothetical protein